MKYLHTMLRVSNLEDSLDFFCNKLGLKELRRSDFEKGRFTLVFLGSDENPESQVELTYNWDPETYSGGRNFGHLAYSVENIYELCSKLLAAGVTINRPRAMATWRSFDLQTTFLSSYCSKVSLYRLVNLGLV